jgi:hypothetical protein
VAKTLAERQRQPPSNQLDKHCTLRFHESDEMMQLLMAEFGHVVPGGSSKQPVQSAY